MSEFGFFLLGTLLRGAVLFGLALLLERCFRNRLAGARARLLWWGMLAVMLVPFRLLPIRLPEVPVPMNRANAAAVSAVSESVAAPAADFVPQSSSVSAVFVSAEPERRLPSLEAAAAWAAVGVMAGAGIAAMLLLGHLLWWQRRLVGCRIIGERRLLKLLVEACRISGMEGRPVTFLDGGNYLETPACCGVWRPCILFPAAKHRQWNDREILMLLVHELTHLRRNDQVWTQAFNWGGILFWFNPFFHFFRKRLSRTWEAECDAAVVRLLELNREGRTGYARLLLDFSLRTNGREWVPGPALSEDGRELKQRMTEVLMERKVSYRRVILAGALLALTAGILTPVFAQASEKKAEQPMREVSPLVAAHGEEVEKSALYQPPELKTKEWDGYSKLTAELVGQKKYQEALNRHRWFFYHILDYDESYYGVRISFAVTAWAELGKVYPPAKAELEAIRDRSEAYLRSGKARLTLPVLNPDGSERDWKKQSAGEGEWQLFFKSMAGDVPIFADMKAVNGYLGTPERSMKVFRFLDAENPALAQKCWVYIEEAVIDNGDFELAKRYIPDLDKKFEMGKELMKRDMNNERLIGIKPENRLHMQRVLLKFDRDKLDRYIKVAKAWGRTADAERMEKERDELLREWNKNDVAVLKKK